MKRKPFSVDVIQFYISRGVIPHPDLYNEFFEATKELERKNQICMLPIITLQTYSDRIKEKIQSRLQKRAKAA